MEGGGSFGGGESPDAGAAAGRTGDGLWNARADSVGPSAQVSARRQTRVGMSSCPSPDRRVQDARPEPRWSDLLFLQRRQVRDQRIQVVFGERRILRGHRRL